MILPTLLLLSSMTCVEQVQLAEMAMSSNQYGIKKEDIFFGEYIPERLKIINDAYQASRFYKHHEKNRVIINYAQKIQKQCETKS